MKITILGRGNAGCFTALHYGYYTRNLKNTSIELIYDPDISPEKVGNISIPNSVADSILIEENVNEN